MEKSLGVWLNEDLIGFLSQDIHGQLSFTYESSWLSKESSFPISHSLPLREESFKQKECRAFFSGTLPEEANREIVAKILGVSARNDYSILEQIGRECAGAISFLPLGEKPEKESYSYKLLSENDLLRVLEQLPRQPLLVGEEGMRLSLAGAQDKVAVRLNEEGEIFLPIGGAPSTHILKPENKRFPSIVKNEVFCLRLAAKLGIPSVKAEACSVNGVEYFLVERYDRKLKKGEEFPFRVHQEDFCQALAISPEKKYQSEGGPTLSDCFHLLRQVSSLPAIDIQNLFGLVIFNLLIGNHDAHGKNFSLIFDEANIRLAPAYDLVSTAFYPELSQKMAMKLGGEYDPMKISIKQLEAFGKSTGLGPASVIDKSVQLAKQVLELLELESSFPELQKLIKDRCERFLERF